MAEPVNTPYPPSTPISATPRSASPALPPAPAILAVTTPPAPASATAAGGPKKPIVLHIGDAVQYNPQTYAAFSAAFEVVRPTAEERARPAFMQALREGRWGNFAAIFRPFWGSGGEMGLWDAELIALLPPSVRVFASAGAGFDWADVQALGARGIVYCNGGLAAAEAVADFAVALIVGVFRALPYCLASGAAAAADPARFQRCHEGATARSRNLRGQVLGLVGLGNIGQQIAHKCGAAFGMDVRYFDVERKAAALEQRLGARFCPSLEALYRASDCVVLCAPAGAGPLATRETLAWLPPGARLVNVARGALVDADALADALDAGRLAAAALDVHADEPRVPPRLAALAHDRVLLTCHNAGGTLETHVGFEELAMRNILAVLAGAAPITPVNTQWLKEE